MELITYLLAPRNLVDGILRGIVFLIGINIFNLAVELPVNGFDITRISIRHELTIATIVGLPFVVVAFAALSHLSALERKLRQLAYQDPLTGLQNRRAFIDMATALHKADSGGTLVLVDADHFKRINDTWGHQAGDRCLVAIAVRLTVAAGPDNAVGRLGGEEFGIFLRRSTATSALQLADSLTRDVATEGLPPNDTTVTLSLGVADGAETASFETLYKRADTALYHAKAQGRGRAELWPPDIHQAIPANTPLNPVQAPG